MDHNNIFFSDRKLFVTTLALTLDKITDMQKNDIETIMDNYSSWKNYLHDNPFDEETQKKINYLDTKFIDYAKSLISSGKDTPGLTIIKNYLQQINVDTNSDYIRYRNAAFIKPFFIVLITIILGIILGSLLFFLK